MRGDGAGLAQARAPRGWTSPVRRMRAAIAEAQHGRIGSARSRLLDLAWELPSWDEPHVRVAELERREGRAGEAAAAYEMALERNPGRVDALIGLAVVKLQQGAPARAQMLLLRACGLQPGRAEAWDALGLALLATDEPAAAEAAFARAQALTPHDLPLALRRSEAAVAAADAATELTRLEVATLLDPLDVVQLTVRGVLLQRLGRPREALDILDAACALAPDAPGPLLELCAALVESADMRRAETALRRAIALVPERKLLRNNLAVVLMRLHRHTEARALIVALMEEEGRQPGFLCNLSTASVALGLQEAGVAAAREAINLAPGMHLGWRSLANALAYSDIVSGADLLEAQRAASRCLPPDAPVAFANPPDPARRVRIGLLSATLATHPVGWLTIAGFEQLDPVAFELVCIGPEQVGDPIQRRFRAIAAAWHEPHAATPEALAAAIRDLRIDVLVDLGGYGDRGMMAACAWRAAPVQVKWVGMQNHSTGLPAMDWFVTDGWETPAALAPLYSERLLTLPDGYVCYSPPAYAPETAPLPALARGHVTFGCFNNLAKVTPRVLATWAEILAAVPTARLVLKTHQFDEAEVCRRVRDDFAAAGGDPHRLELRGSSAHRMLLAQYADIDIVLDPFPYTGGLTTCEALWMGVPTVTLAGETFAGRHAASHLSNVGLPDWVATDLADYRRLAIARAGDIAALASLRASLRERVRASPLCDGPRFGRNLGSALRRAWAEWCARAPEPAEGWPAAESSCAGSP